VSTAVDVQGVPRVADVADGTTHVARQVVIDEDLPLWWTSSRLTWRG
jgi:hypothetical protein